MSTNYRVPVLESYEFQPSIISNALSTPPGSPVKGDRYIVKATGINSWTGHDNHIAWYDGSIWKFDIPKVGTILWLQNLNKFYYFNQSSAWSDLAADLSFGDMLKSTYDINANNIVDKAESVDDGAGNSSTAANVKDAVTKKHTHTNQATLDAIEQAFTTALKTTYDNAVSNSHTHSNKTILDAIEVALTNTLKSNYDTAYNSRATYDAGLGCITFNL
jgi:hypothetical protein